MKLIANLNENKRTIVITEAQARLIQESLILEAFSLSDIKEKYYPNIPDEVYYEIVKSDPTWREEAPDKMGKYGKWLLSLYMNNSLKTEDLYKAKEYLAYFVKYYNKIEQKDINKYKSLPELFKVIKPFKDAADRGEEIATSKSDEVRRMKEEEAKKFYEDERWLVVIPLTQEASCYYGKGTQWCTAATQSYNMFARYDSEGPLYINIDKANNRKYQFHFESESFMDENDEPISPAIADTIDMSNQLLEKYRQELGNKAYLYLTEYIYTDTEETSILGEGDYFCVFDNYDGYASIISMENGKREVLISDLTDDNRVEYVGNDTFKYFKSEDEYDDYDFEYNQGEILILFNAKTRNSIETIPDNLNRDSINNINSKYYKIKENSVTNIIDKSTLEVVYSVKNTNSDRYDFGGIDDEFKLYRQKPNYFEEIYGPDIIICGNVRKQNDENGGTYSTHKLFAFDLKNGRAIVPENYNDSMRLQPTPKNLTPGLNYYDPLTDTAYIINSDGSVTECNQFHYKQQENNESVIHPMQITEAMLNEATLSDIKQKYYPNLDEDMFWKLVSIDPTWNKDNPEKKGKYFKWIIDTYNRNPQDVMNNYDNIKVALNAFNKFYQRLENKDINAYKSYDQLYSAVSEFLDNPDQATSKSDEVRRMKDMGAKKVYEDETWLIVVPLTWEASKYYGKGTQWCTAMKDNSRYFENYTSDGPLYININKQTGEKYQFHFESNSFMDASDSAIKSGVIADEIGLTRGACEFYESLGEDKGREINEIDRSLEDREEIYNDGDFYAYYENEQDPVIHIETPNSYYEINRYDGDMNCNDYDDMDKTLCDLFPTGLITALMDHAGEEFVVPAVMYSIGTALQKIYEYEYLGSTGFLLEKSVQDEEKVHKVVDVDADNYANTRIIYDFSKDGFTVCEVLNGQDLLRVYNEEEDLFNIFSLSQMNYVMKTNVDSCWYNYRVKGYFAIKDNVGIIQSSDLSEGQQPFTFPAPQNERMNLFDARGNLIIVRTGLGNMFMYSVVKKSYLNINLAGYSLDSMGDSNDESIIIYAKDEKKVEVAKRYRQDLINTLKPTGNILSLIHNPDSDMPVILQSGDIITRKQFFEMKGVYELAKEAFDNPRDWEAEYNEEMNSYRN